MLFWHLILNTYHTVRTIALKLLFSIFYALLFKHQVFFVGEDKSEVKQFFAFPGFWLILKSNIFLKSFFRFSKITTNWVGGSLWHKLELTCWHTHFFCPSIFLSLFISFFLSFFLNLNSLRSPRRRTGRNSPFGQNWEFQDFFQKTKFEEKFSTDWK